VWYHYVLIAGMIAVELDIPWQRFCDRSDGAQTSLCASWPCQSSPEAEPSFLDRAKCQLGWKQRSKQADATEAAPLCVGTRERKEGDFCETSLICPAP